MEPGTRSGTLLWGSTSLGVGFLFCYTGVGSQLPRVPLAQSFEPATGRGTEAAGGCQGHSVSPFQVEAGSRNSKEGRADPCPGS